MIKVQLIKSFVKGCEKCGERSKDYHYCLQPVMASSGFDKNCLLLVDFPSRSQLGESNLYAGNTGKLYEKIIQNLIQEGFNVCVIFAIRCFKEIDNNKVSISDLKEAHNSLIKNTALKSFDLIIVMGKVAISVLVGKTATIKEFRHRVYKNRDMVLSVTFTPLQAAFEPNFNETILRDVEWIIDKYKNRYKPEIAPIYLVNPSLTLTFAPEYKFALDVETEGFNSFLPDKKLLTLALSDKEGEAVGFTYDHPDSERLPGHKYGFIKAMLLSRNFTMIGHNIKFDYLWLKNKFNTQINCSIFDTLIAYNVLDENAPDNSLKAFSALFTDIKTHYEDGIDSSKLAETPIDKVLQYNMTDADATFRIYNIFYKKCEEKGKLPLLDFLNTSLKTIANIEYTGMFVDREFTDKSACEFGKELVESEKTLVDFGLIKGKNNNKGFGNDDILELLYSPNCLGLPVLAKTDGGQPSIDRNTISDLLQLPNLSKQQIDVLVAYQKFKLNSKIYTTYFEGMEAFIAPDGRIHPSFNLSKSIDLNEQFGTVTGRLSCRNPNLQNIPRLNSVRGCFAAQPDYYLIDCDYSQLELRVAAWYAKEKKMYNIFDAGQDLHSSVLASMLKMPYDEVITIRGDKNHPRYNEIEEQRVVAKTINFGILYGMGSGLLMETCRRLKVSITRDEAQKMINQWLNGFPKVNKWLQETQNQAKTTGVVSSPTGRDRHLPGAYRNDSVGLGQLRQAINFPVQTLASEICLAALNICANWFVERNLDIRIVLTVHDSIIFEVNNKYKPKEDVLIHNIKQLMTKCVAD